MLFGAVYLDGLRSNSVFSRLQEQKYSLQTITRSSIPCQFHSVELRQGELASRVQKNLLSRKDVGTCLHFFSVHLRSEEELGA